MLQGIVRSATPQGNTKVADAAAQELLTETTRHQEITHLGDQIRLNHNNERFVLQEANLDMADGNSAGALADYRYLLTRNPHDDAARSALKAFYLQLGRPGLAKEATQLSFMP